MTWVDPRTAAPQAICGGDWVENNEGSGRRDAALNTANAHAPNELHGCTSVTTVISGTDVMYVGSCIRCCYVLRWPVDVRPGARVGGTSWPDEPLPPQKEN